MRRFTLSTKANKLVEDPKGSWVPLQDAQKLWAKVEAMREALQLSDRMLRELENEDE